MVAIRSQGGEHLGRPGDPSLTIGKAQRLPLQGHRGSGNAELLRDGSVRHPAERTQHVLAPLDTPATGRSEWQNAQARPTAPDGLVR
jgi:hypothetical protein